MRNQYNPIIIAPNDVECCAQYAEPYTFDIFNNGNAETRFSLKHPGLGYAVRSIDHNHIAAVDKIRRNPVETIFAFIDDMKKELDSSYKPSLPPSPKFRFVPDELAKKETKPKPPACPTHRNLLVPAEEGILKCPVQGCKKRMRRKVKGDAAPEEVTLGVDVGKEEVAVRRYINSDDLLQERILLEAQRLALFPEGVPSPGVLPVNENPPRIFFQNNRWYLAQFTNDGTMEVVIDITSINPRYEVIRSPVGFEERVLRCEW